MSESVSVTREIAASAERQRKRIQQDRFAGAGFAGQHGKAFGEVDVEPLDQDDVTDRKPGQHLKRILTET